MGNVQGPSVAVVDDMTIEAEDVALACEVQAGKSVLSGNEPKRQHYLKQAELVRALGRVLVLAGGVNEIINSSAGVYGFHLNGDLESWSGFGEVDELRQALAECDRIREGKV